MMLAIPTPKILSKKKHTFLFCDQRFNTLVKKSTNSVKKRRFCRILNKGFKDEMLGCHLHSCFLRFDVLSMTSCRKSVLWCV